MKAAQDSGVKADKNPDEERRFRQFFEHASDPMFVNHLSGTGKLGAFAEVNNAACRNLLYSKEEFRNLSLYSIVSAEAYDTLRHMLAQLQKEKRAIVQLDFLRKDKRPIPVEISALLFEFENKSTIISTARDISGHKQTEEKLKDATDRLRELSKRLQQIREEERTIIAREIHDELGQVLTVLKIQLSLAEKKLHPNQIEVIEKMDYACDLLDQTVKSVQQISAKLRPGILDELGLIPAIEWQTREFEKRADISCRLSLSTEPPDIAQEKATALFRIFQEALTNVARHSRAKRVSVFLKFQPDNLILEITDNGRGISQTQINASSSLGILGMRERVMVFGGTMEINGIPGEGTHIKVTMPLD